MTIEFVESVDSTQKVLMGGVRSGAIKPPFALVAREQTQGMGSRNNEWQGFCGNLFFSFCMDETALPNDLPSPSVSIYFSMIMREILAAKGSQIWLKWPNDFYINEKKIGGTITTKINSVLICGMGINLKFAPQNAGVLDIKTDANEVAGEFCRQLKNPPSWRQIWDKFKLEFEKSRAFSAHDKGEKILLKDAKLLPDGSLDVDGRRIFSLR